jgi:hypothetical protein
MSNRNQKSEKRLKQANTQHGEYEEATYPSSRLSGQRHFLLAVKDQVPSVLEDLHSTVFDLLSPLGVNRSWIDAHHFWQSQVPERKKKQIDRRLFEWASRWNIAEEWCIDEGRWTVVAWLADRQLEQNLEWAFQSKLVHPSALDLYPRSYTKISKLHRRLEKTADRTFAVLAGQLSEIRSSFINRRSIETNEWLALFVFETWNPLEETANSYQQRLRDAFNEWSKAYVKEVRMLAPAFEMVLRPRKRDESHFEWLAKFQVQKLSFTDIAKEVKQSSEAVTEAVKRTAELIALNARRSPRGRPRK